ncbi:hypothetical protein JB92DRAFT_2264095 [Gautieria morchelliformis]|nr:hypothetical protein JB92DRAFT_2264095 [Gautieria morchelliformis]
MGNFKHQSLRGDLTRADRDRERDRERDRDNERDKEGHERLRSVRLVSLSYKSSLIFPQLSDMYDRDRMALPLALPPLMRSQQRDSAPHLSASTLAPNASSSGRLGAREGRDRADRDKDRDRDRDGGRRSENRESGRRKGGESGDWRRGAP